MTAVTDVTFLLTPQYMYTKNPELCSLRCGDEFGLELNWNLTLAALMRGNSKSDTESPKRFRKRKVTIEKTTRH